MNSVFVLEHSYELDGCDENKFIGVYSNKVKAEDAIDRLSKLNGFKYTIKGFVISEIEMNKDHWEEGFITMTSIHVKSIQNKWIKISAEILPNNQYLIVEKNENDQLGNFKDGDIVKCKEESGELYAVEKIK